MKEIKVDDPRFIADTNRKIKALEEGVTLLNRFTLGLAFLTLTIGIISLAAYLRG